jgi:hypothetical protein
VILDQHTVDDVRQLMRTVEFRIDRSRDLVNHLPFTRENVALVDEWNTFVDERWKKGHDDAITTMIALKVANPLVNETILPAESTFKSLMRILFAKGEGTVSPGDLSDIINRLETASGLKLDEKGAPPANFDPDLGAFLAADAAIKKGEAAEKALVASLPSVPTTGSVLGSIPWWGWAIAAAVVGGVGYSVYQTGRQVKEKAERDTAYIHENMTGKFLPGYKG